MTYRLWFDDLGNTVAEDQYAFDWLAVMRKRYPDANVWIEPAPGATPTFRFLKTKTMRTRIAIPLSSRASVVRIAIA
jgi:hypothetical protein